MWRTIPQPASARLSILEIFIWPIFQNVHLATWEETGDKGVVSWILSTTYY